MSSNTCSRPPPGQPGASPRVRLWATPGCAQQVSSQPGLGRPTFSQRLGASLRWECWTGLYSTEDNCPWVDNACVALPCPGGRTAPADWPSGFATGTAAFPSATAGGGCPHSRLLPHWGQEGQGWPGPRTGEGARDTHCSHTPGRDHEGERERKPLGVRAKRSRGGPRKSWVRSLWARPRPSPASVCSPGHLGQQH